MKTPEVVASPKLICDADTEQGMLRGAESHLDSGSLGGQLCRYRHDEGRWTETEDGRQIAVTQREGWKN